MNCPDCGSETEYHREFGGDCLLCGADRADWGCPDCDISHHGTPCPKAVLAEMRRKASGSVKSYSYSAAEDFGCTLPRIMKRGAR